MRQTHWNGVFGILLMGLAACSAEQPAETPRPALVVQPGGGAEAALSAYAGEVRAREESPLAFRVGGNLVRRNVDAGARVQKGEVLALLDAGDFALQAQAAQAQLASAEAGARVGVPGCSWLWVANWVPASSRGSECVSVVDEGVMTFGVSGGQTVGNPAHIGGG